MNEIFPASRDKILHRALRNITFIGDTRHDFILARRLARLARQHPKSSKVRSLLVRTTLSHSAKQSFPWHPSKWQYAEALVRAGLARSYAGWEKAEISVIAGGYSSNWWTRSGQQGPVDYTSPLVVATAWRPHPRPSRWAKTQYLHVLAGRDEGQQPFAISIPRKVIGQDGNLKRALEWVRPRGWHKADMVIRQGDVFALGTRRADAQMAPRHQLVLQHPEHAAIVLPQGYVWRFGRARSYFRGEVRPVGD